MNDHNCFDNLIFECQEMLLQKDLPEVLRVEVAKALMMITAARNLLESDEL